MPIAHVVARRTPKKRRKRRKYRALRALSLRTPLTSLFARRLRLLIHFSGVKPLSEVDRLAGVKANATHAILTKTRNPRIDTAVCFARLFGVSLDWLATGCGRRPHLRTLRAAVSYARANPPETAAETDADVADVADTATTGRRPTRRNGRAVSSVGPVLARDART